MEIILVNDCSTDETASVLTQLAATYDQVRVFNLPENRGPSHARNLGWDNARGDYIAFLDSDDTWHPQKIELQMRMLDLLPDLAILGHLADVADEGDPSPTYELSQPELLSRIQHLTRRSVLRSNPWSTPTVLIRADVSGRFNEDMRAAEDYLLWADVLLSGGAGARLNIPLSRLYKARYGAGGLSGNLWKMELGELKAFRLMRSRRYIGFGTFISASTYSLAKFAFRVVKNSSRRS